MKIDYITGENRRSTLLGSSYYNFYREEDGSVFIADNKGFICSKAEVEKLIKGLNSFLENYDDEIIKNHNINKINKINNPVGSTLKKSKETKSGFVYLIKADNGLVKIGKTVELKSRLDHFTAKLPYEVTLIHFIETNDYTALEKLLHQEYMKYRSRGEWFELGEKQIKSIKRKYGKIYNVRR